MYYLYIKNPGHTRREGKRLWTTKSLHEVVWLNKKIKKNMCEESNFIKIKYN